jgi:hypothetical protein
MFREIRRTLARAAMGLALAARAANAAWASNDMDRQQLAAQLPLIAERTIEWAKAVEAKSLAGGATLTLEQQKLARSVGVRNPERIRLLVVDRIPLPDEPVLAKAAEGVGLSQSWAAGLTLGHAVIVRRGFERDPRLLSHEFRHVAQYETVGGIGPFLVSHLRSLVEVGYEKSPFEVDARAHER